MAGDAPEAGPARRRPEPARFTCPVSVHLFLFDGERVLLLKRANTGFMDGRWSVPAGHIDGGEDVRVASAREAMEEAGIVVSAGDLEFAGVVHHGGAGERVHFFFACRTWQGSPVNAEPDKCEDLAWHSLGSLPELMVPYVETALANYQRGVLFDVVDWD
jgi:8-oxo-dGTP diphosphatase